MGANRSPTRSFLRSVGLSRSSWGDRCYTPKASKRSVTGAGLSSRGNEEKIHFEKYKWDWADPYVLIEGIFKLRPSAIEYVQSDCLIETETVQNQWGSFRPLTGHRWHTSLSPRALHSYAHLREQDMD